MTHLPQLYTDAQTKDFIKDVLLPHNEVWVTEEAGHVVGLVGFGKRVPPGICGCIGRFRTEEWVRRS